jgi:hypothetical protein
MSEIDENYQKEVEEIRKLDKSVWSAANKRAKSKQVSVTKKPQLRGF